MISQIIPIGRIIVIAGLVGAVIWFVKDYQYQKAENKRQSANTNQLLNYVRDSAANAQLVLSEKEIKNHLLQENGQLLKNLRDQNIKLRRVERIVNQILQFRDTTTNEIKAVGLVRAVKLGTPMSLPVLDTTDCWVTGGVIEFNGEEIFLKITDRQFKNVSDYVAYQERRKWKFLFFNTRIFGKKEIKVQVFNSCGGTETKTLVIDKRKG